MQTWSGGDGRTAALELGDLTTVLSVRALVLEMARDDPGGGAADDDVRAPMSGGVVEFGEVVALKGDVADGHVLLEVGHAGGSGYEQDIVAVSE